MIKRFEGSFIVKNDKNIIFFTFLLVFFVFLFSFIKELNYRKEVLHTYITQKQETIDGIYAMQINQLRKSYTQHLDKIINSKEFKTSLLTNDFNITKEVLKEQFDFMTKENEYVKTLYFVDEKNICKYRAHDPEKNGDEISCNMPIVEEVNDTKVSISMFDAGDYGLYYRVTLPILYDGVHYGALEVGIDFRLFLEQFGDIVDDTEWILLVDANKIKKRLELESWGTYKVLQSSNQIPMAIVSKQSKEVMYKDKYYFIDTNFVIKGINKKDIAKIFFFIDITKQKKDYYNAIYTQTITFIFSSIFIFGIFFVSFRLYKSELEKKSNEARKKDQFIKEQLQDEVNKRVQELKQQEAILLEQSKLAIMGEMIGMIAHQWRQPLSHISLNLEALRTVYEFNDHQISSDELDKYINKAVDRVLFMSSIIDDFRNFFKPDEDMQTEQVKDIILKAIQFVDFSLQSNQIQVVCECECNKMVQVYVSKFVQVLINIIKNAEDALIENQKAYRQITISCFVENEYVTILIKDNAGGIQEEYLQKIFEPYFSTKSKNQTGLGLYMCKMIVQKHLMGAISAYNDNSGAVFKVQLPIYEQSRSDI